MHMIGLLKHTHTRAHDKGDKKTQTSKIYSRRIGNQADFIRKPQNLLQNGLCISNGPSCYNYVHPTNG